MKQLSLLSLVIFNLIFLASCSKKCENIEVPYTIRETYTELVTRNVKLDHQESALYHQRQSGYLVTGELPQIKVKCTISNSSKYGGNFNLYSKLESQGQTLVLDDDFYIPAFSSRECEIVKEINSFSFQTDVQVVEWHVEAPTITVQVEEKRYRDVTKYRTCNTCDPACRGDLANR